MSCPRMLKHLDQSRCDEGQGRQAILLDIVTAMDPHVYNRSKEKQSEIVTVFSIQATFVMTPLAAQHETPTSDIIILT